MVHSDYLNLVFDKDKLKVMLRKAQETLKGVKFDAVAVSGNSGVLFGSALAVLMEKGIFLVRKEKDGSHSSHRVEGDDDHKTYIFVDDFIASGNTARWVVEQMSKYFPNTELVGALRYREYSCRHDSVVFDEVKAFLQLAHINNYQFQRKYTAELQLTPHQAVAVRDGYTAELGMVTFPTHTRMEVDYDYNRLHITVRCGLSKNAITFDRTFTNEFTIPVGNVKYTVRLVEP